MRPRRTRDETTRTATRSRRGWQSVSTVDLLPVEAEAAAERAVPQVEHLLDVGEVVAGRLAPVGVREAEADAAEVQPVRVGPQPLDLRRPSVARDVRVADRRPRASSSVKPNRSIVQPDGFGAVCQPHCESVPSGIVSS